MPDERVVKGVADGGRATLALGLALASLVAMIVLAAADADGPIWLLQGALAAAATIVGWTARGERLAGRARIAVVLGVLLLIAFAVGTALEA